MNKPITLCDKCDIYMRCLLDYDGIPCRKNRTVEPTNADRIRAMTDEELAEWTATLLSCPPGPDLEELCCSQNVCDMVFSCKCWLNWLKQEVTE